MKEFLFLLLSFSLTFFKGSLTFAQTDTSRINIEEITNDLLDNSQDENISSELYDILENLAENPIDLNTAGISELQQIPLIDFAAAGSILSHREKYGLFFSVNELYSVNGIDPELVRKIIPFFKIGTKVMEPEQSENLLEQISSGSEIHLRNRVINDLQIRKGFRENKFEGSAEHLYNRIKIKYDDNLQLGLLMEKDSGEKDFNDFTSFHFSVKDLGFLKNIVFGDYYLEFGQGLTLWNSFGFSKGSDAVYSLKKSERKIIPYTSSSENSFLRGVAGTIDFNLLSLSFFYSGKRFDADISGLTGEITWVPLDGMHRTGNEIKRRKTAVETIIGGRIDFLPGNSFKIGLLHYRSDFDHPFQPSGVYDIKGERFNYTSAAYDLTLNNLNLSGETVYNGTSVASITNLQLSFYRNLMFVTSVRYYPENFVNLHGHGFGERAGAVTNEFGIYNGLRWHLPFGNISFYYDQFKFPYATSDNPLPSGGNEVYIELSTRPLKQIATKLRYKQERKELTFKIEDEKLLLHRNRKNIRTEVAYEISRFLRWKSRFEYNAFSVEDSDISEEGFMFFQDLRFRSSSDLTIYGRIIFFRTESFNSAVYEYENDVTGISVNPGLYGEGIRWYFVVKYKIFSFLVLSCKYSETYKPKERTLGSGDSEINDNLDNRINFQVDLNL